MRAGEENSRRRTGNAFEIAGLMLAQSFGRRSAGSADSAAGKRIHDGEVVRAHGAALIDWSSGRRPWSEGESMLVDLPARQEWGDERIGKPSVGLRTPSRQGMARTALV